jgi:uncharacterized protein YmfQ (DUF2313 family)
VELVFHEVLVDFPLTKDAQEFSSLDECALCGNVSKSRKEEVKAKIFCTGAAKQF